MSPSLQSLSRIRAWVLGVAAPSSRDPLGAVDPRRTMPELDGLRALALLMIMLTHWVLFGNSGNLLQDLPMAVVRTLWAGVDMFFVLSGFLITGILADTLHDPHFFRNFYARRALRIFPLYYLVLLGVFFLFPHLLPPKATLWFSPPGEWWYFTFLSNFAEGMGEAKHAVLVVTWSLAVEEHYYLIWPLLVWRFRTHVDRLALGTLLGSFLLRALFLHGVGTNGQLVAVLTPFRLDGLALGSLIAVLMRQGPAMQARLRELARRAILPLVLLIAVLIVVHEAQVRHHVFPGHGQAPIIISVGFLVAALFFGSVLVLALTGSARGNLTALLRWRPLTDLGRISFAAYLLHEPVHLFCRSWLYGPLGLTYQPSARWLLMLPLQFLMVVALSTASWVWLEKPILGLKRHFQAPRPTPSNNGTANGE